MYHSSATQVDALLVDIEHGTVLNAPAEASVSERWVDSHPFVHLTLTHVVVGPDSERVARGFGGQDYMLYERIGSDIGRLYLRRES